jgi:hypothetical protein
MVGKNSGVCSLITNDVKNTTNELRFANVPLRNTPRKSVRKSSKRRTWLQLFQKSLIPLG